MESLHKKFKDSGLDILAFPANDFRGQEPGTNLEIKKFCEAKKVSFRLFEKISVKGEKAHPLYKFLVNKKKNPKTDDEVKWNFHKFLVAPDGSIIAGFGPREDPMGDKVVKAVKKALDKVPEAKRKYPPTAELKKAGKAKGKSKKKDAAKS